ncbi:MAG: hypothetical protein RML15_06965 [Bacteroidota bacterium]|nr:hypothetical protein [Candidatus Kapabacteria bacterium]MCX7936990.1 hypothetical protein [Chlorobiota bacterium]MDW8075631.1 hypothetical protein [Bacteroidota bacterium]MDW8272134.1 hypothetical protein [Bacteroidota bacterium]
MRKVLPPSVALAGLMVALSTTGWTRAEDTTGSSIRIGASALGGITLHVADFSSLPELPSCCPQFREGSGLSAGAAVWGEYAIGSNFSLGLRIGIARFAGMLRALERKPVLLDDTPTDAVIQHSLSTQFHSMRWEGYLDVRASQVLDVYLGIGTDLIQFAEGNIREELVQPDRGTFENGSRTRNERSASLVGTVRSMPSLTAGMRFSIPLGTLQQWSLMPELCFRYGLEPIARTQQWYVYSVLVGIGIAFEPVRFRPSPSPPPPAVEPPETPLTLAASIIAYGVANTREHVPLRIEEQRRHRIIPLLPVIFAENSEIPERYLLPTSATDSSWISTLSSPLAAYYALLPILGQRLRSTTDTCTIVSIDPRSIALARRRAEYVARYLQAIWKIPSARLRITTRTDDRDTIARILLECSSHTLRPVVHVDTVRILVPSVLRLRPATNGAAPLDRWVIRLIQDSTDIAIRTGRGGLPLRVDVDLASYGERLKPGRPLLVRLEVESTAGSRAWAEELIPLEFAHLNTLQQSERTAVAEYFLFPSDQLSADSARALAARYHGRLEEVTIVAYGNSPAVEEAIRSTTTALIQAGFSAPRVERHEPLYRPFSPERKQYSELIAIQLRYREE